MDAVKKPGDAVVQCPILASTVNSLVTKDYCKSECEHFVKYDAETESVVCKYPRMLRVVQVYGRKNT